MGRQGVQRSGMTYQGSTWPRLTPAQAEMVEANTGLVGFVLERIGCPPVDWDDRFQDGLVGLMRAVQKFEPERGFQFSTYALNWIRAGIGRGRIVAEGSGFRLAQRNGVEYQRPCSLDHDAHAIQSPGNTQGMTLADRLVDARPTPDRPAEAAVLIDQIRTTVAGWHLDRLDRTIADAIVTPDDRSWRQRELEISQAFGCSHEIVRRRRFRIHARIRSHFQTEVAA